MVHLPCELCKSSTREKKSAITLKIFSRLQTFFFLSDFQHCRTTPFLKHFCKTSVSPFPKFSKFQKSTVARISFLSFNENTLVARNSKKLHPERSRKFENWTLLTTFYTLLPTLVSPGILWLRFLSQDDRRFPRLKLYQNNGSEEEISGNRIIIIIPRHYTRIERVYATLPPSLIIFSLFRSNTEDMTVSVEEQDHFGIFNWRKIFVIRTRPGTTNSLA